MVLVVVVLCQAIRNFCVQLGTFPNRYLAKRRGLVGSPVRTAAAAGSHSNRIFWLYNLKPTIYDLPTPGLVYTRAAGSWPGGWLKGKQEQTHRSGAKRAVRLVRSTPARALTVNH